MMIENVFSNLIYSYMKYYSSYLSIGGIFLFLSKNYNLYTDDLSQNKDFALSESIEILFLGGQKLLQNLILTWYVALLHFF